MNLYEVAYPRLEALRKEALKRELADAGWDVWTDFRYEIGSGKTVIVDLLARRDGMIKIIELTGNGARGKREEELQRLADENGWEFLLEPVADPLAQKEARVDELAPLRKDFEALTSAHEVQQNPAVRRAISAQAVVLASRIVSEMIRRAVPEHAGNDVLEAARRLVDKNKLSDQLFERIVHLHNLRNKLARDVPIADEAASMKDAIRVVQDMGALAED